MSARHDHTDPFGFDRHVREAVPMPIDEPVTPDAPRLGPGSLTWKFYGDVRVQLFGFQRLASTENAIAELAQAVSEHSVIFGDFLGRALRTARPVLKTIYSDDPHGWGRTVRDFHTGIKGTMPGGERYHALNPELFYWAHATFIDQIIYCTDTFVRRLTRAEKEQIFEEGKIWYALYGISARRQPDSYDEFVRYWDSMLERFTSTKVVRYGTGYIRKGLPPLGPISPTAVAGVVGADERLHPHHDHRHPPAAAASGVRPGLVSAAGEHLPTQHRGHPGPRPGFQPASGARALHPLGGGRMGTRRHRPARTPPPPAPRLPGIAMSSTN